MLKPSSELIAIAHRWSEAIDRRDGETLRNLLSTSEYLSYIGTAEGELWNGKVLHDGIGEHFREVPRYDIGEKLIEAFECGNMGWAYWIVPLRFAGSQNFVDHRVSMIFALELGSWKIMHVHVSNPISNMEKMGIENKALDALVAAAKAGFQGAGRTGMASVMFTDIADSTALAGIVGDQAWAQAIQSHIDLVKSQIALHGGTLVKSLGDGTMSTFPSARAALLTAQAVQQRVSAPSEGLPLRVRIGIHTGDVIQTENDFFGTVVNKAARIAAHSEPEEIWLSDATRMMASENKGFVFDDEATVPLKGIEGAHLIHRMQWADIQVPPADQQG